MSLTPNLSVPVKTRYYERFSEDTTNNGYEMGSKRQRINTKSNDAAEFNTSHDIPYSINGQQQIVKTVLKLGLSVHYHLVQKFAVSSTPSAVWDDNQHIINEIMSHRCLENKCWNDAIDMNCNISHLTIAVDFERDIVYFGHRFNGICNGDIYAVYQHSTESQKQLVVRSLRLLSNVYYSLFQVDTV